MSRIKNLSGLCGIRAFGVAGAFRILLLAGLGFAAVMASSASAQADPRIWREEGWTQTDFSRRTVEWAEILSGGPPRDGIPPIDRPRFSTLAGARNLEAQEAVIGLEINGEARAYPIRILMWHEIVNDTIGGVPVTVTYCPLCNAAIVFDRRTSAGTLDFGTSGKLRNSDLIMYDRQTESWWQQFSGEAIVGKLTGSTLKILPARLESFAAFKARHPKGHVLKPTNPGFRPYGRNPYQGYDLSTVPFLYRGDLPEGIEPMARVVVVRGAKRAHAVSLQLLRDKRRIELAGHVLSWTAGQASALETGSVAGGRDVGNVVVRRILASGETQDAPYDVTFAFVFHAFHPDEKITQSCAASGTVTCGNT